MEKREKGGDRSFVSHACEEERERVEAKGAFSMPTREGRREKGPSFVVRLSEEISGEGGRRGRHPRGPTMPMGPF